MGETSSNQRVEESAATITELECQYCRKKCFFNNELLKHERSHFENKRLRCHICGIGITNKACMTEHMRIHSDTRSFQCNVCSKQFKFNSNLVNHQRIHTGDKRFKCYICHASFVLKKNMEEHIKTHTKEKPLTCPSHQCGKKFARRSTLVRHMKTHTGLRPFGCAHCEWTFARKYDLQRHLSRQHQDSQKTKGTKNEKLRRTKAAKEAEESLSNLDHHQIKIEEVQVAIGTVVDETSNLGDDYELLDELEDIKKEILPVPVEVINDGLEENVAVSTSSGTRDCNNNALFGDYILRELSTFSPQRQLLLKTSISELITEAKSQM